VNAVPEQRQFTLEREPGEPRSDRERRDVDDHEERGRQIVDP
jgi:hypothetical protein